MEAYWKNMGAQQILRQYIQVTRIYSYKALEVTLGPWLVPKLGTFLLGFRKGTGTWKRIVSSLCQTSFPSS